MKPVVRLFIPEFLAIVIALICLPIGGWAQPGALDPAFHRNSLFDGTIFASAAQADGKVVLGGAFTRVTGVPRNGIARVTPTGSLDTSFNPGIGVEGAGIAVYALALYTNGTQMGKIVIAGSFAEFNRVARGGIARLNADGSLDTSFDPGTGIEDGDVLAVAIQSDGKILVGGDFTTVQGKVRNGVARFNDDGSLDTEFTTGAGADDTVYGVAVQPDGKIVVAGAFSTFRGANRPGVARLTRTGSLDSTSGFDPGDGAEGGFVYALAVQGDGKIILGGDFTSVQGEPRDGVARLNSDGSLDLEFAPDSGGTEPIIVWAVAPAADDQVLVAGEFITMGNAPADGIARLDAQGNPDPTFTNTRPETVVFNVGHGEYVLTMAVQNDGSIVAGGTFELVDNLYRPALVRILTNGAVDRVFNQESGTFDAVLASAVQPDGKLVLGGRFTLANGESRRGLARLNADGTLDTGFGVGDGVVGRVLALEVYTNGPQAGKIVIGGTFTNVNGFTVSGLARINTNGSVDTTFSPEVLTNEVDALALQSDGKIVIGGAFTTVNGVSRNGIARLNIDGSLDSSLDPGSGIDGEAIYAVAIQTNGAIVVAGAFTNFNGVARSGLARLDSLGALDTSFNPGSGIEGGAARAVVVQPDGHVVVAGGFTSADSVPRNGIARFRANGELDPEFNPGEGIGSGEIYSVARQTNGQLVIGGSFTNFNTIPSGGIARLDADGSFDFGFDPGSGVSRAKATVHSVMLQPDGKVVVGGFFLEIDGVEAWGVTRLLGGPAVPTAPSLVWWPAGLTALQDDSVSLSIRAAGSKPLGYQWFFNSSALAGETNALLQLPSLATNQAGSYVVVVTNAYGAATSPPVVLNVIATLDIGEAVNAEELTWTVGGDRRWYGQSTVERGDGAAGQSGPIDADQQSVLSTTVTGPGWLSFWWKVSSEEGYDLLEFRVNDEEWDRISGEVDWAQRTFLISPGLATLTWSYVKDQIATAGEDAGWLDQVTFIPSPTLTPSITTNLLLQLDVQSASGQRLAIQASTTLTNWTTLIVLTNTSDHLEFVDETSTNFTRRFYRLSISAE